ncbi:MAG: hypothetical protein AVDCRST_MAG90-3296, partial [uncultured Microvirga sp.]
CFLTRLAGRATSRTPCSTKPSPRRCAP